MATGCGLGFDDGNTVTGTFRRVEASLTAHGQPLVCVETRGQPVWWDSEGIVGVQKLAG